MSNETEAETGGNYHEVRSLVKGLALLCEINRRSNGAATAAQLSAVTRLNRSTVKRLLETLRSAGFVDRLEDGQSYALTFRVKQLSDGFNDAAEISVCARPALKHLTQTILWPVTLCTREGHKMVVRYSTNSFSPLSYRPGLVGDKLPMLPTATGRAYLSFCSDDEREYLLAILRGRPGLPGELARSAKAVEQIMGDSRARGFAVNDGELQGQQTFSSLAAPIIVDNQVIACIAVTYARRVLSIGQACKQYGPKLLDTAKKVEAAYVAQHETV